jgi:hypothetical protein
MKKLKAKARSKNHNGANLVRRRTFSADELLKHVSPGTQEEAEDFVRLIYAERQRDLGHVTLEPPPGIL